MIIFVNIGRCATAFHVNCAMKEGLLCGPSENPQHSFTLTCKKHISSTSDKEVNGLLDPIPPVEEEEEEEEDEEIAYCSCKIDTGGMMIECASGITCNGWVHASCEGLSKVFLS